MHTKHDRFKGQGGFTLIELISVVIILGILAAVIVPKYLSMTDKAKDAVYLAALNEGVGQFNIAYAKYALNNTSAPTALSQLQVTDYLGSTGTDFGDYTIKYSGGGSGNLVTMALYKSADNGTQLQFSNSTNAQSAFTWPS